MQADGTLAVADLTVWAHSVCGQRFEDTGPSPRYPGESLQSWIGREKTRLDMVIAYDECLLGTVQPVWDSTITNYTVVSVDGAPLTDVEAIAALGS